MIKRKYNLIANILILQDRLELENQFSCTILMEWDTHDLAVYLRRLMEDLGLVDYSVFTKD